MALAPSRPVAAPQCLSRRVSGHRELPQHQISLSSTVCPSLPGAEGWILPRCLQQDDGQDVLPTRGCCLSSQLRQCWIRTANYSSSFNDFWTCHFVMRCLAPFSRCLLGYLCIQVSQAGSGEAARLQAALLSMATPLVLIQG